MHLLTRELPRGSSPRKAHVVGHLIRALGYELAKRVTGEEEVPDGVVAVLTGDAPDVLSHLAVRARNMKVCARTDIASCSDLISQWWRNACSVVMRISQT